MKNKIHKAAIILSMGFITYVNPTEAMAQTEVLSSNQNSNDMSSFISIFEIPATDLSRAVNFYQAILNVNIEKMEMPGMEMGIFPYEGQLVTGVIVKGDGYNPSADGVTIYLNGGDNLQIILDKVEEREGKLLCLKRPMQMKADFSQCFLTQKEIKWDCTLRTE